MNNTKKPKKVKPSAYDILACLEKYDVGSFEYFCADFGYADSPIGEYPNVMNTYQDCMEQFRGLRCIFTVEQIEQLREII